MLCDAPQGGGPATPLEADDIAAADRDLVEAYRRQPPDPLRVEAAHRLAGGTTPPW